MKNVVYAMVALLCLMGSVLMGLYILMTGREALDTFGLDRYSSIDRTSESCAAPTGAYLQSISASFVAEDASKCDEVELDTETRTLAVVVYEGKTAGNFTIGESEDQSFLVPVYVDKLTAPVNLVLSSFVPVMWDLKFKDPVDKAMIRQIVVSQSAGAAVRNAAAETKVVFAGGSYCQKETGYEEWTQDGLKQHLETTYGVAPKVAMQMYGVNSVLVNEAVLEGKVSATLPQDNEDGFVIDADGNPTKPKKPYDVKGFIGGDKIAATEPVTIDAIPGGMAGLDYQVKQGVLRKMTEADMKAFETATAAHEKETGMKEENHASFGAGTYVMVKKKMRMPKGMFGANAGATILMPKSEGYEIEGNSHNSVCYMDTGTCTM